ncbi:MAG TPA: DUF4097 family beta strand repeat-containing protein [Candidatus Polarisedimenticolia bacterium]|nr:DUF4097 family beta strand repeat-containing protein [Candidatus Polarisedimenticolia bacterium]
MTQNLRRGGIALLAFIAVAATGELTAADSTTRTFPFRPGELMKIDTGLGHIEIRTARGTQATITVTSESGKLADLLELEFEDTAEGVTVTGRKPGGDGWGKGWLSGWTGKSDNVEFLVEVPDGADFDLKSSGGHIRFPDVTGDMRASTAGGHIKGGRLGRGGQLDTAGGHIEVVGSGGELIAKTAGGHITLSEIEGGVTAETAGGHIEVNGCEGTAGLSTSGGHITLRRMNGQVTANTAGGNIRAELDGRGEGADLTTSGGSIEVAVGPGAGYEVDAYARGGSVESEIRGLEAPRSGDRQRLRGTIGSGGGLLKLRTSHGRIRITESGV